MEVALDYVDGSVVLALIRAKLEVVEWVSRAYFCQFPLCEWLHLLRSTLSELSLAVFAHGEVRCVEEN